MLRKSLAFLISAKLDNSITRPLIETRSIWKCAFYDFFNFVLLKFSHVIKKSYAACALYNTQELESRGTFLTACTNDNL